ncbi:fusion glycoprotein F0 [uncultured Prochlorococcus sp.]|uniref:fusion glycoprotein F0 n=1 Tax=uncultured Prochlorococcus sp. TaxID=159733 RepID=UPI00258E5DB1|nr:fusion glycoprotein F0 [uncultured Prochlorococcus sp.]
MNLNINKYILPLIFTGFIIILIPSTSYANEFNSINKYFGATQQKTVINYEKSQPSSIDNPVVDPNFNTMRSKDTESSTATYIVIGLLIAATIIPLATWWYFSK